MFKNQYSNHSDRRTAGWIGARQLVPKEGTPHRFSEQLGERLQTQDVFEVWLGWSNEPNRTEDVTGFFDEFLRKDAVRAGETIGVEHAEAFRVLDLS